MSEVLSTALFGTGSQGLRLAQNMEKAEFRVDYAFGNQNREKIHELFHDCHFLDYRDSGVIREAMANCQAVFIATPPETHFGLTELALFEKTPVFLEKPASLLLCNTQELSRLAEKFNVRVVVDFTFCWSEIVQSARGIIVRLQYDNHELYDFFANLTYLKKFSDETLLHPKWNLGIHLLAVLLHLLPEITENNIKNIKFLCSVNPNNNEERSVRIQFFSSAEQCGTIYLDFLHQLDWHGNMIEAALKDFRLAVDDPNHQPISDIHFALKVQRFLEKLQPNPFL